MNSHLLRVEKVSKKVREATYSQEYLEEAWEERERDMWMVPFNAASTLVKTFLMKCVLCSVGKNSCSWL